MSYEEGVAEQQYNEKVKAAGNLVYYANSSTDDKMFQGLELLDQAIALKPNNSSAYYTKAYTIAQIKEVSRVGYIPVTVSNENLKIAFDSLLICANLERDKKWAFDNFTYVFLNRKLDNSHGEPGKTNLPFDDAQIEELAAVFGKIFKEDQNQEEHIEIYEECMFDIVSKAAFRYKNKKLLEFVVELSDFLIKNKEPYNLNYRLEKAAAQKDLGLDQDSAESYKDLLKRSPNFAYHIMDRILFDDWNKTHIKGPDVIAEISKIVRLEPNNARAYYTLGRALENFYPNEIAKAVKHYQMSVSLIKNEESWMIDCYFNLARLLSVEFKNEEALTIILKAEEFEKGNAKVRLEKGRILKSLRKYPEALQEVEAAQKLNAKAAERGADKVTCSNDEIYRELLALQNKV